MSFTWQEIVSQPETWQATLTRFAEQRVDVEHFLHKTQPDQILVIGCGSTYYLARSAAVLLGQQTGLPAYALPSSELWLYGHSQANKNTLLLAVSRSGTTTETLWACEKFQKQYGGPTMTITCTPESTLAQNVDQVLACPDAQEQSVAQTRSFSSMFILTQALAALWAKDEATLSALGTLPETLRTLITRLGDTSQRLGKSAGIHRFFFLGNGVLYGLACEAMLKTKEMSLSYAETFHPMEFRHGPMSMVDEHTLVVGLLSDTGLKQEIQVLADMQQLGGRTLALVDDAEMLGASRPDEVVELGSGLDEWQRGALVLPVLQRLAFHRAVSKGLNPDQPHNLKAVIEL